MELGVMELGATSSEVSHHHLYVANTISITCFTCRVPHCVEGQVSKGEVCESEVKVCESEVKVCETEV